MNKLSIDIIRETYNTAVSNYALMTHIKQWI